VIYVVTKNKEVTTMYTNEFRINYHVTGADRKALVQAISEITGAKSEYLGAPTFAYQVDYFTISKDGILSFDDRADSEEIENLLEELAKRGFEGEPPEGPEDPPEKPKEKKESLPPLDPENGVTIIFPRTVIDEDTLPKLKKLVAAKGWLIKKALGTDTLKIETTPKGVEFPWFTFKPESPDCRAYAAFIEKLVALARNLQRVSAKEKPVANEKYAFRCFLLRLGFIGKEWKGTRKILMRNFKGSAAYKGGAGK